MLYHPYQPLAHSPSPSSRQSKVTLQRVYREKEVESFKTLRGVIKDLTGQEPRTREDTLLKAIDMLRLLAALEIEKQSENRWEVNNHSTQSPHYWHASAETDGFSYHDHTLPAAYDQQYHVGHGEGLFDYEHPLGQYPGQFS